MFPEPDVIGKYFHELFKVLPEQQKKKLEWKKNKKGKVSKGKVIKGKEKRKPKFDNVGDLCMVPEVELAGNASSFAVFATVRLAVLERWMKDACEIYLSSSGSSPAAIALTDVDSDVEESSERLQVSLPRIPKIVGVGLRSVFELIRESRNSQPVFCTKALRALLDILQGQQPEGLKHEPAEVIDPLFELLLDLATLHGPLPDSPDDGSHLTAVACSCLLSLVTVRGDTGRLLCAVAALLMSPRALAYQNIMMPSVLASLQRSVHGVLLGKTARPDWINCGVPKSSYLMSFDVKLPAGADYRIAGISSSSTNNGNNVYSTSASSSSSSCSTVILAVGSTSGDASAATAVTSSTSRNACARALASDGRYLYLHNSKGLFKIGSGYGGTLKGHIYMHNHDFYNDKKGWLGYAQDCLYFRLLGTNSGVGRGELISLETDDLTIQSVTRIDSYCDGVMFSDGEFLGVITSAKDDGFVVRTVNPSSTPSYSLNELPLKLARKCVDVCGVASFDEESAMHTLHSGTDDEVSSIVSGKEFSLIRTTFGKVLYCGKSASLGMKQGGKASKWAELIIPKSPKINMIAAGHDGLHAVLVAEDGSVFFTGTARRGEDGDQNKVRRQPKAVKPKKISKVDGQMIVHAACNNGTTALVTKDGELIMFGKDTTHCDPSTGIVTDLKDVQVVQVTLGKAHAAVLSSKGQLYSFGINNKGQCGRDFASQVKEATVVAMETAVEEEGGEEEELEWDDAQEAMCAPGTHKWKHDLCMVCTICRECTGYSISCLSSMRPDRNPGQYVLTIIYLLVIFCVFL